MQNKCTNRTTGQMNGKCFIWCNHVMRVVSCEHMYIAGVGETVQTNTYTLGLWCKKKKSKIWDDCVCVCEQRKKNNGKMFGNIWRYKRKIKNTCRSVGGHVCFWECNTKTGRYIDTFLFILTPSPSMETFHR